MAENLQKESVCEEFYKKIIQASIDGFWITDLQGHFLEVNDSYCSLTGYNHEELLKMKISDIEALEKQEDVAKRIEKIIKIGGDRFETRHKCKDGKIIDIEISVNYIKEEGGRLCVFARDITEKNREKEESEKTIHFMMDRELRMVELKKEIEELKSKLSKK